MAHRKQEHCHQIYYGSAPPYRVLKKLFASDKSSAHLERAIKERGKPHRKGGSVRSPESPLTLPPLVEYEGDVDSRDALTAHYAENCETLKGESGRNQTPIGTGANQPPVVTSRDQDPLGSGRGKVLTLSSTGGMQQPFGYGRGQ